MNQALVPAINQRIADFDLTTYKDSNGRMYHDEYVIVNKSSSGTSILFQAGIRLKLKEGTTGAFICCVPGCDSYSNPIKLQKSSTGEATKHLNAKHNIKSAVTQSKLENRLFASNNTAAAKKAMAKYHNDPRRFYSLEYTKAMVIAELLPFSHADNPRQRLFRSLSMVQDFPKNLSGKRVKVCLIEIYAALKANIASVMEEAKEIYVGLPFIHLSMDLWKSLKSGEKYIGIKIYFSLHGQTRKFSLAIRLFDPNPAIRSSSQLSDILKSWTVSVLKEFGISEKMVIGSTSDSGTDVKRCLNVCFNINWEWCLAHMANCALVEASGTTKDPQKSKNKEFRKLNKMAKSVFGLFIKSPTAETELKVCLEAVNLNPEAKVLSWKHHRWCSFVRCLGRLLYMWPALVLYYSQRGTIFSLTERKRELIQCYSILIHVKEAIVICQSDGVSVLGYMAFLELISMAVSRNGLEIVDVFEMCGAHVGNPDSPTIVEHEDLDEVSRELREKLIESLYTRFYIRYSPTMSVTSGKCSYEFDTAALFYPPNNNGAMVEEYVRLVWEMTGQVASADRLKEHSSDILEFCWNKIRRLGIKHCKEIRQIEAENDVGESASVLMNQQQEKASPELSSSSSSSSLTSNGRLYVSTLALTKRFRLRMSANTTDATASVETSLLTPEQVVDAEIKKYKDQHFDFDDTNPDSALKWWQSQKD